MNELAVHRVGEGNKGLLALVSEPIAVDTFGGEFMWSGIHKPR